MVQMDPHKTLMNSHVLEGKFVYRNNPDSLHNYYRDFPQLEYVFVPFIRNCNNFGIS